MTVNPNGVSVTISQALTSPAGYGLGTTGSTLSVTAGSGGAGYVAPPVVKFSAPAGGVAATGVAVLSGGSVSGIIITSPGSGYTSGQNVTVTFNNNSNTSGAATTIAGSFSAPASTLNSSGALTVLGGGTLTVFRRQQLHGRHDA